MTVMIETLDAEYEAPPAPHREAASAPAAPQIPPAAALAAAVERELWRAVRLHAD